MELDGGEADVRPQVLGRRCTLEVRVSAVARDSVWEYCPDTRKEELLSASWLVSILRILKITSGCHTVVIEILQQAIVRAFGIHGMPIAVLL